MLSHQVIPPPPDPIDWEEAARLYVEEELSYAEIARRMGRHPQSIRASLLAHGVRSRRPKAPNRRRWGESLYGIWKRMKRRCSDPGHPSYRHYGAKGVRVCREWEKFEAFYGWSKESGYRSGMSLALKGRARTYSPRGCEWVGLQEKSTRSRRLAPPRPRRLITAFGEKKGAAEWVRDPRCRVGLDTLCRRLDHGLDPEDSISLPGKVTQDAARRRRKKLKRVSAKKRSTTAIPWEEAVRLHLEKGLSCPEIAIVLGVSYQGVLNGLKRRGVYKARKPRLSSTPVGRSLREAWRAMHERCHDPRHAAYRYYGAKGARVCREWRTFEPFYDWAAGSGYRRGLCLTRIDRKRSYSPANCTWSTRAEAARLADHPPRKRKPRWTIRAFGEEKGPTAWSRDRRCAVSLTSLLRRLRSGMDAEKAIATPPEKGGDQPPRSALTAFGETKGLTAWSKDRRCRVTLGTLLYRLEHGIAPEAAITTPPFKLWIEPT